MPGVSTICGANEPITAGNGAAILIDAGPLNRYGEALKALPEALTEKPLRRVSILTHYHADHVLNATTFDGGVVSADRDLTEDLKRYDNDLTNGMYHVAGDCMRGSGMPEPGRLTSDGRRFRMLCLSGPREDLYLFPESSGLLFPGNLVFLYHAAATVDATLPAWRNSPSLSRGSIMRSSDRATAWSRLAPAASTKPAVR